MIVAILRIFWGFSFVNDALDRRSMPSWPVIQMRRHCRRQVFRRGRMGNFGWYYYGTNALIQNWLIHQYFRFKLGFILAFLARYSNTEGWWGWRWKSFIQMRQSRASGRGGYSVTSMSTYETNLRKTLGEFLESWKLSTPHGMFYWHTLYISCLNLKP